MKYDYAGGVLPHERQTVERFEDQVLPFVERHGARIGEMAMQGNVACEEVIRRYRQFLEGDPTYRETCFGHLVRALKLAEPAITQ